MDDIDDQTRDRAARRYTMLRRRLWWFFRMMLGWWAISFAIFAIVKRPGRAGAVLVIVVIFGFLFWWAGFGFTCSALRQFRCPRCGQRFLLSWYSSWPTAACKHCGLYLG